MLMQITEKELGATKYNKNIVQYLFAAIIIISFITMALTASLVLKTRPTYGSTLLLLHYYCPFCSCYFCLGLIFFLKARKPGFFLISACPVNCHAVAAIPDVLLWPDKLFSKSIFCHFTSESVIKQIGFGLLPFELQSFPLNLSSKRSIASRILPSSGVQSRPCAFSIS